MNAAEPASGPSGRMKALRAHARGGPEQLRYEEAPIPQLRNGSDVCVRVSAAAITFDELTWPDTWAADGVDRTPIIPSHEFAGVVAAVGPEIDDLSIGDDVFGLVPFDRDGAAAEYVVVPRADLAAKPATVPDVVAAAAALPALTAWQALDHSQLAAGGRLLVRGGSGAVGSFLLQFARERGIEVTTTVRSAAGEERARRLGAHDVLVGDAVGRIAPASVDAAIDAVGAGTPEVFYRAVRPDGLLITLQEPPDPALAEDAGIGALFFVVSPHTEELERLAAVLATATVDVGVAQTYPLSQGRAAYASRGSTTARGKVVLTVAPG